MIETLKLANPDVRIILMAPTYAEYDIAGLAHNGSNYYGKEYNYSDYRQMIKEAAAETNTKYVNSWNYLKDYYDFDVTTKSGKYQYYKDSVHMNSTGQQVLAEYLANGMTDWYLNGEFADSTTDADYQFAVSDANKIKLNLTVTSKELNKEFVIGNGKTVLNGSNVLSSGNFLSISADKKIKFTEEGEYVITINTKTNDITVTKKRNAVIYYTTFDSSSSMAKTYKVEANSEGNYVFDVNFIQWGAIQINYNGTYLSTAKTSFSGEYSSTFPDVNSTKLYTDGKTTTFFCAYTTGGLYTFTYNPTLDTMDISVKKLEEDGSGFAYLGTHTGTVEANSDGKYVFEVELPIWGSVVMKYNGLTISSATVSVSGAFTTQGALWNDKLYHDGNDTSTFYCCIGEQGNPSVTNRYKFTYDPVAKTLVIEHLEKEVGKEGLELVPAQNVSSYDITEANGIYTITVEGNGKNYPGFRIYYNGTELTSSSVTTTGSGFYPDWGSLNASTKVGLYYQPDDGQSVPGWFSISSGTFELVYNSTTNTLTIEVK